MSDKSSSSPSPQADPLMNTEPSTGLSQTTALATADAETQLKHLFQFEEKVNEIQDEQALLEHLAQVLVAVIGVDHVGVALAEPDGKRARVMTEYPAQGSIGYHIDFTEGIAAILGEKRQPIFVDEVDQPEIYGVASVEAMKALGVRQAVFIPLFDWQQKLAGSVGLDIVTQSEFEFTPSVRQFAEMLVKRANAAFQRIQLRQFNQRQQLQLQAITAFSQAILAMDDMPTVFSSLLWTGREIIPMDWMGVVLVDEHDQKLYLRASLSANDSEIITYPEQERSVALKNTLAGQVWDTVEPLLVRDIQDEMLHTVFEEDLRAFVISPIITQGTQFGLTIAASRTPHAFDIYDLNAFQQMTNQLSVALENMEIHAATQQSAKNKALINEISGKLQQQLEIEELLHITAAELGKALGARHARIRLNVQPVDKK